MSQKIVLATNNQGKVKELASLLANSGFDIVSQREFAVPDAEETGLTFIENAIIKARHASALTQLPAIADDSGIAVDYLGGQPGIYSARYAGHHGSDAENNHKLLAALAGVPTEQRQAQFHCALVYLRHAEDPVPIICHGIWHGVILTAPHGDGGFGYDPLFYIPELDCTSADLSREQKNQLSHRGQALKQLLTLLK